MKITDDKKDIKIEVKTSLGSTKYEVSFHEMAAMIGQFQAQHDMTNEQFIETFIGTTN